MNIVCSGACHIPAGGASGRGEDGEIPHLYHNAVGFISRLDRRSKCTRYPAARVWLRAASATAQPVSRAVRSHLRLLRAFQRESYRSCDYPSDKWIRLSDPRSFFSLERRAWDRTGGDRCCGGRRHIRSTRLISQPTTRLFRPQWEQCLAVA